MPFDMGMPEKESPPPQDEGFVQQSIADCAILLQVLRSELEWPEVGATVTGPGSELLPEGLGWGFGAPMFGAFDPGGVV